MALIEGGRDFDARRANMVPQTEPFSKYTGESGNIKKGHLLVQISGTQVQKPTLSGGIITSPKVLGHSAMDDFSELPTEFAVMPYVERNGLKEILVHVADGETVFTLATTSGQSALLSHVGKKVNFRYDATLDQITLDPSANNTAYAYAVIVGVHPSDVGEEQGRLDYRIPAAVSQWETGTT